MRQVWLGTSSVPGVTFGGEEIAAGVVWKAGFEDLTAEVDRNFSIPNPCRFTEKKTFLDRFDRDVLRAFLKIGSGESTDLLRVLEDPRLFQNQNIFPFLWISKSYFAFFRSAAQSSGHSPFLTQPEEFVIMLKEFEASL